jgi:exodeoxyribonuclease VII small subunit
MNNSLLDSLTFEQALAELEQVVQALEEGQIGLEEALGCYEKGVGLLKRCYTQLQQAEQRIQLLAGVKPDGQPVLQPFDTPVQAEVNEAKKRAKTTSESADLF